MEFPHYPHYYKQNPVPLVLPENIQLCYYVPQPGELNSRAAPCLLKFIEVVMDEAYASRKSAATEKSAGRSLVVC